MDATTWGGEALAALLMKAKAIWNHDAFFDYFDRIMGPKPCIIIPTFYPPGSPQQADLFVTDMYKAYRKSVPDQPDGKDNLKWVYNDDHKSGHFEANPKPDANPKPAN